MRARSIGPVLGFAVLLLAPWGNGQSLDVAVKTARGEPIEGLELWVRAADSLGFERFGTATDAAGRVQLPASEVARSIVFQAPGWGSRVERVLAAQSQLTVVLAEVTPISFVIKAPAGYDLPSGVRPSIYWEGVGGDAWLSIQNGLRTSDPDAFSVVPVVPVEWSKSAARFEISFPPAHPKAFLLLHEPGFLQAFHVAIGGSEAVAELKEKVEEFPGIELVAPVLSEITLPAPASLSVTFAPRDGTSPSYEACGVELGLAVTLPPTDRWFFTIDKSPFQETGFERSWTDLTPGQYQVAAHTGRPEDRWSGEGLVFNDRRAVTVKGEETARVAIEWEPFDTNRFAGDHRAVVQVSTHSGKPAQGASYRLTTYDNRYGQHTVREGRLDDEGQVTLEGLAGGEGVARLTFNVDLMRLGELTLGAGNSKEHRFDFSLPPSIGDSAPDLELTELKSGEIVHLADYRGEVLYLDFWATWCGPCQGPMAHSQEIVTRRATDWKGRARIIGLSIDDEIETLRSHVETKGWTDVHHLFASDGEPGWGSRAAEIYGIHGVPTALLIDASGKIIWRGHPANFEIEKAIDDLLKGSGD